MPGTETFMRRKQSGGWSEAEAFLHPTELVPFGNIPRVKAGNTRGAADTAAETRVGGINFTCGQRVKARHSQSASGCLETFNSNNCFWF